MSFINRSDNNNNNNRERNLDHLAGAKPQEQPQVQEADKAALYGHRKVTVLTKFNSFPTAKKVGLAIGATLVILATAFVPLLVGGIAHVYKTRRIKNTEIENLKKGIANATFTSLKEAASVGLASDTLGKIKSPHTMRELNLNENLLKQNLIDCYQGLVPDKIINEKKFEKFVTDCITLQNWIDAKQKDKSLSIKDINDFRNRLNNLLENPIYETTKEIKNCYLINYLQFLCIKIVSGKCQGILKKYGESEAQKLDNKAQYTCSDLSALIRANLKSSPFWKRDSKAETYLSWAPVHIANAANSAISQNVPLDFNAHTNNPAMSAHTFELGNAKIQFFYTPTPYAPGGNKIYKAMKDALYKLGLKYTHISHQDTKGHDFELVRMQKFEEEAQKDPDTITHAVLALDSTFKAADAQKHKNGFIFTTPQGLFKDHLTKIFESNKPLGKECQGVYITDGFLSPNQVQDGVKQSKEMIKDLYNSNKAAWDDKINSQKGKARLVKMSILATHGMLCLGHVVRSLNAQKPHLKEAREGRDPDLAVDRVSQACKQDIDRGPVENVTLQLFFRLLKDDSPLTKDEVHEMLAPVIARARIVEERDILQKRVQVLEDLLDFVGGNQAIVTKHVREYAESLGVKLPDLPEPQMENLHIE